MSSSDPPSPDKKFVSQTYANNFGFLRLVFASLVILSHAPPLMYGYGHDDWLARTTHTTTFGTMAVSGFFILSGYLIAQSWQRTPLIAVFLQKRALRIYPGFVCASLISILLVGYLGSQSPAYYAQLNAFDVFKNLVTLGVPQTPPCFIGARFGGVNGALWTIRYEFTCYLLVMLAGLCGLLTRRRTLLGLFLALLALSVLRQAQLKLFHFFIFSLHTDPGALFGFAALFLSGTCFHLFRDKIRFDSRIAWAAGVVLAVCLFEFHASKLAIATCGAYLLFYFAFLPLPRLQQVGRRSDISYGIYLYGWPVQQLLLWYYPGMLEWTFTLAALALSAVCGLLSWRFVEQPFLKLKRSGSGNGVEVRSGRTENG